MFDPIRIQGMRNVIQRNYNPQTAEESQVSVQAADHMFENQAFQEMISVLTTKDTSTLTV